MKTKKSILDEDLSRNDPRIKQILVKIKKENYRPDALIEILHTAQNSFGFLPMKVLAFITKELKVPPSRVYSTVTFYHFFSLKSKGEHTCLVCTGTACYVKGAERILAEVQKEFSLKPGHGPLYRRLRPCSGDCHR
jgi:bidirectional [NiFe] hydrogenase diaphorase subunit